ncbi:hydroxymethylbilane synthase [Fodinibius halophilus]|uniref:Porphobilinogen deaminase n=1 Tax=Fodinibius halophilus TaxID=1736908 RepID=A0A6M1T5A1_9BACT|nr:hydroxymethylbilane synthase [Fodinibius halophilus]NGP89237.1 hydroxymethylbilane synthase [Fodinibius halophilus]
MSKKTSIRIGTRDSQLATWQAKQVAKKLQDLGYETELIFVKSEGDIDLTTPLTEMGGKGVFTKALDDAQLNDEIDIAVHSFKDLPTENPLPLKVAAIMKRADARDSLVAPDGTGFLNDPDYEATIATSSNRRRAQWLHRYPNHNIVNIRGNVNTRLEKVEKNDWDGAIFAAAGLERIDLGHHISEYLDWIVSAAAQGAMAVMIREGDSEMEEIISQLDHDETALCTTIERDFLHDMEAGCSAPVGAYAYIENSHVHFKAIALTLDGMESYDYEEVVSVGEAGELGHSAAQALLSEGAIKVIEEMKKSEK